MENKIEHHFSSGVYAREFNVVKDSHVKTHKHVYDHMSILAQGCVIVVIGGEQFEYVAPAVITIKAGLEHDIFAVEDCIWFCVHATDEENEEHIDEVLIQGS